METFNDLMKQVLPILMIPVKNYLRYLISCPKYMRDMGIKMTELTTAKVGVEEHMTRNANSHLEVPAEVIVWLVAVEQINAKVENVPSDVGGCLNLNIRHRVGKKAFNYIEDIDSVMRRLSLITWTDQPIPLGKVDTLKASTSRQAIEHDDIRSREVTFTKALQALGSNHKAHMVALCGMGGVGKTTMMEKLKGVVEKKKMFNYIVPAVVGQKTDHDAIQNTMADYLGIELSESTQRARADKIRKWFEDNSNSREGKNKFLIVLDDVWQFVNLEDIGLSTSLLDQGVNFKVLLTSRKRDVMSMMGIESSLILNIEALEEAEAQNLFLRFVEVADRELHQIGEDIVKTCYGLPIAIKTMALTLRNKSKDSWKDALSRLEDHDIENVVKEVFEMSYRNLQDKETEAVFLLCGLFLEDFDIRTEELVRYGWGLNLFKNVYTIGRARRRLNACIERLIDSNLLIKSNYVGCVKMHDLVRAFVLDMYSKVEHSSIINHGSISRWPDNSTSDSCKAISLTGKGMLEFPKDLKVPNLLILKLMHGDKSLTFPQDVYGEMGKLQVLSYSKMKYPLTPSPPQCSTNLRVLHLHECSLIFDCSPIGELLNLEILTFANSGIKWLPAAIGNLKKLRLMDMTGSCGLHIDKGVLENLIKLEELYMRVGSQPVRFTYENCNEMARLSKKLSALEFEFFENDAQPKHMSFENLERFKISVGRSLQGDDLIHSRHSFENTLKLVINIGELLKSQMNELFKKTEVLCLSVGYMNDLSDIEVESSYPLKSSSFYNLRALVISECTELRYLFTLGVANTLSKLEHLEVYKCNNMKELVHIEGSGEETIIFPKLKFLYLNGLPNLLGLCHNVKIIELPQLMELKLDAIPGFTAIYSQNKLETSCLLKEEFVIPKLEKLHINDMKNLEEIWPCDFQRSDYEVKLREIEVTNCDNLVNMFPCNPLSLLHHLVKLRVHSCDSIEVLFELDVDYAGEIREGGIGSSLRSIELAELGKLREVWRIKGADSSCPLICGFQNVEIIWIRECERFRNVFTPITTNFDMRALTEILIYGCRQYMRNNELIEISQEEKQTDIVSHEETSQVNDTSNDVVQSSLIHSFHNLRKLHLSDCEGAEVVFEIKSPTGRELVTTRDYQQPILPYLDDLKIRHMGRMRHVWKCNWNKFFVLEKQQSESPFQNLTTISIHKCGSIKYLFSPLMAKLLFSLREVQITWCDGMEEVVSNRDDEDEENTTFTSITSHTTITLFPHLHSLTLYELPNLKRIGGGASEISLCNSISTTTSASGHQFKPSQLGGIPWTLCQYFIEISITTCDALSSVVPCYAVGQMQKLQVLRITSCDGMKEVFETQRMNKKKKKKSGYDEDNGAIPRLNNVIMLPNLKTLIIKQCELLEHIFTFSALESLRQLEELTIEGCKAIKVIVKEEDANGEQAKMTSSKEVVVFPRLRSITLLNLPELVGFFLGKNEFRWPSLDEVIIRKCPKMMVFVAGVSTAPQLNYIHTSFGKLSLEEFGLNFHVTTAAHHQTSFPSSFPATSQGIPVSFHNLIEIDVSNNRSIDKIIPSDEFLHLQKLEKIYVSSCTRVKEVFEAIGTNSSSGFDESQTTLVKLPNLRVVELEYLDYLRDIWNNNQLTTFEFPNLTTLSIQFCGSLKHVFSSSMVGSLLQLQKLSITYCGLIEEVIVNDTNEDVEESDGKMTEIVLPCLKSLLLENLFYLKGFSLGKEIFSFPSLDTLVIKRCSQIMTFTEGSLTTPKLKEIETNSGSFYVAGENINSFIKSKQEEFIN